jgi:hypothetical protein
MCRAACAWPSGNASQALLLAQVDQLAGVRSTSSTISVICFSLTHSGRTGTISLVSTLDMLDVAAVASAPALRDEMTVSMNRSSSGPNEGDFVGQLISAAVLDPQASLLSVLMHCGTMTRMFVAEVDTEMHEVTVESTVLSMESSLEVCTSLCVALNAMKTNAAVVQTVQLAVTDVHAGMLVPCCAAASSCDSVSLRFCTSETRVERLTLACTELEKLSRF